MAFWVLAVVVVVILVQAYEQSQKTQVPKFAYPSFFKLLKTPKLNQSPLRSGVGDIGEIRGVVKEEFARVGRKRVHHYGEYRRPRARLPSRMASPKYESNSNNSLLWCSP